jgi:hypothetical protein
MIFLTICDALHGRLFLSALSVPLTQISIGRCEAGIRTVLNVCRTGNARGAPNLPQTCSAIGFAVQGCWKIRENCAIIKIYADRFLSDASNDGTMRFGQSRRGLSASAGLKGAIECSSS